MDTRLTKSAEQRTALGLRTLPRTPARVEPGPSQWWRPSRAWLVAVIPAALGLVTGGYRLGAPPLWRDEAATKAIASRSVAQILATMPHDDVVHGAYYLVVHVIETAAGSSNAALRFPSMLAMAVAAAVTAAAARRLAALAGSPYPATTGLAAGMLFALIPYTIRYAQEARSYAMVTMLAAVSTYLLLKCVCDGGRWWVGYGIAVGLTGLFNLFGLLILVAHAISLLISRWPGTARPAEQDTRRLPGLAGLRVAGLPARWLIAGMAALGVLGPLIAMAYSQRAALGWVSAPGSISKIIIVIARLWAGSPELVWPVFGLAAFAVAADAVGHWRCRPAFTPATIALPWLVAPAAVLLAVSEVRPVYDIRYVEYACPPWPC